MGDIIFQRNVPIFIKTQIKDEKKMDIHVFIQIVNASSSQSRKELLMRLTDEKDAHFFFTLHLAEDEYDRIKLEQGLVMDFFSFPAKLIEQLEMVIAEDGKDMPRRLVQLSNTTKAFPGVPVTLDIISTTDISRRACLSLQMLPGTEVDINNHLAETVKSLKEANLNLLRKLEWTESDLGSQLKQARDALANRTQENAELRSELVTRITELTNQNAREVNGEKERFLQTQQQMQRDYEKEKKKLEQEHSASVKQLENKVAELTAYNKDLVDAKSQLEYSVKNLKSQLSSSEEERVRLREDFQLLRKDHSKLLCDHAESERLCAQGSTKIAVLEQELKDKNEVCALNSEQLTTERIITRKLHGEIEQKDLEAAKDKSAIKLLSNDVIKGREIIEKMKQEMRNINSKLKLRTQITLQQEKLLGEKQKDFEELKRSSDATADTLGRKEEEIRRLEEQVGRSNEMLEESRKILKKNESVISWLNKQITDTQLSQRTGDSTTLANSSYNTLKQNTSSAPAFIGTMPNSSHGVTRPAILGQQTGQMSERSSGQVHYEQTRNDHQIDEKYFRPDADTNPPSRPDHPRFTGPHHRYNTAGPSNPSLQRFSTTPHTRLSPPIASAYFPFKAS